MCMSQDRNNILCEERNMGKFRSNIPEYCCINNKNVLCNPQKAPSQLTSGIPSRPTRGHGWTQDSWRYCEDAQKSH